MAEEIKDTVVEPAGKDAANKLIKDIADVKATMVPKSDYEQMVAERDKLKHALLTGATNTDSEPSKSAKELRTDYMDAIKNGVPNVQGFETTLKLRAAVINETGKDPFMTEALERIDPSFGERVAEGINELVEKSNGSPEMFNALLSQNIR